MRVRQQALGHGHRKIWDARCLNQHSNVAICLSISRTLAQKNQRALGVLEQVQSALHRVRSRNLPRCCVNDFDE